jgi:N-acetylglucosaminyl-diphospho-decaprenol L-rhamnosyltransferase
VTVSVVIPALGDTGLLAGTLPPLAAELLRRAAGDEVIVVDDTGRGELAPWLAERFPGVRAVTRAANGGFAQALTSGIDAAAHDLVFSLNSDVRVRPGFLEPLEAALAGERVFAAVPRVLLNGAEEAVESLTRFTLRRGVVEAVQPGLAQSPGPEVGSAGPVAFAVGGTMLFRRQDFRALGGFDPLFEPFYWEDVDLSWRAWRAGMTVVYQPASVVEHHHRGTISVHGKPAWIRAAIERNRLLFQWKHLDGPALAEHLAALYRMLFDAYVADRRDELLWLALALEHGEAAAAARAGLPEPVAPFEELMRRAGGDAE